MFQKLARKLSSLVSLAKTELSTLKALHPAVDSVLTRLESEDPGLRQYLKQAYGYAIFPDVGKASAVVGGAFGKGEVFERGRQVGYAGLIQVTVGVQLGGNTFSEIIAFQDKAALERFKAGKVKFAANASAVLVKAGAAASADFASGVAVFVHSEGGLLAEAAVGGQKFVFRPSVLGRGKRANPRAHDSKTPTSRKTPPRAKSRTSDSGNSSAHGLRRKKSRGRSPQHAGT